MDKFYKRTINFEQDSFGIERQQEWLDGIDKFGGYLPKGIYLKDIDTSFIEFVNRELSPVTKLKKSDGIIEEPMPVIFLTAQRWAEFTKTYDLTLDEFKDISLPFITIIRNNDVQVGTINNGNYNIAGRRNWIQLEVPTFENGRKGVDLYKIPQPTAVDLTYEVRVFSSRVNEQNSASEKIHLKFDELQKYLIVHGHPMPVKFESVSDESEMDLEDRKIFITTYEMLVQGYILDEKEFEVISSVNRVATHFEVDDYKKEKGIKMKANFDLVLVDFKNKLIVSDVSNGQSYRVTSSVSVIKKTADEFCRMHPEFLNCSDFIKHSK